jgi:hypothetical protein
MSSDAKVVFTHTVVDVDRWLKGKADRVAALGSNVVDYVAEDGSEQHRYQRRRRRSRRDASDVGLAACRGPSTENTVSSLPSLPT